MCGLQAQQTAKSIANLNNIVLLTPYNAKQLQNAGHHVPTSAKTKYKESLQQLHDTWIFTLLAYVKISVSRFLELKKEFYRNLELL